MTEAHGPLAERGEHRIRLTEQEAQANLHTMLQSCETGALRCSERTQRPTAATLQTIAARLAHGDFYATEPIAAFAWPLLLQAGGLASIESGRLTLTAKGRQALRKPPAETIRLLWQRWLTRGVIDEMSRVEAIKGQRSANTLSATATRRRTVADALATCLPEEWMDVDVLFATMRRRGLTPTVARNERARWKLYIEEVRYGSLGYDSPHSWKVVEGRYTLAVVFEYAGTLGLVDLDYVHPHGARTDFRDLWGTDYLPALSRYDGLQAIRLTPLGRYVLDLDATYTPPVTPSQAPGMTILATGEVVVTGDLAPGDEILLSAFAERTSERVWSLSASGLLTALDGGRDLADLVTFLEAHASTGVPDVVARLLADVARRAAHLKDLGQVRLIECADPALAALITKDRALRALCRPVGDRHVAVPPDQEPAFRAALIRLGYALTRS